MNTIGRMYPNLSASELSSIILKGKNRIFESQTPAFIEVDIFTQSSPYGVQLREYKNSIQDDFLQKYVS